VRPKPATRSSLAKLIRSKPEENKPTATEYDLQKTRSLMRALNATMERTDYGKFTMRMEISVSVLPPEYL
jgi:hypothetical protein